MQTKSIKFQNILPVNENKEINDTSKNSYIWIQQENTLTKIEINQIKICK